MNTENAMFTILDKIPLFKELSDESYKLIMEKITLEYFPAKHQIFAEGEEGDAMYIIKKGQVKIYHGASDDPDEQEEVKTLEKNSFFGEMALISDKPRNASAMTLTETELFVLKKDDFYHLVANNPSLAEQISSEFIQRIKENMRKKGIS